MAEQWSKHIWPTLAAHDPNFESVVDLASGRGRNTAALLSAGAKHVTCVDVNPENLEFCRSRFAGQPVEFVQNDGQSLAPLQDGVASLIYCWDALVHFDLRFIAAYVDESARVLKPGGIFFAHHSNYTGAPGKNFTYSPHWRNFMSADIFRHLALTAGLEICSQTLIDWGEDKNLDCISVVRRPSN